jgi:hypothetical protein
MPKKQQSRIIFRDAKGRFLSPRKRYTKEVASVQAKRGGQYVTIIKDKTPTPSGLVDLLNQREFEQLPEALVKVKSYSTKSKYAAWDIAEQIDKTKRVRRKNLKFTMQIQDGQRLKTIEFYHHIKSNKASSYAIFRRINAEVGIEGFHLYNTIRGRHIADRKGKQVKLVGITVEEVI